jgi:Bardet-Biedl syndrome 1 protein
MAHAGKLMTQSYSHDADPSGMTPNPDAPRVPKPKTTPKWLDAWSDPMAHVDATSELMDTADLAGDGEWRLVMCSRVERKIKVWANARLVSEQSLPDEPVAMRCFYALPTDGGARKPSVAVAAGSCVFIFRGNGGGGFENANRALRPHYKFTTPSLPVEPRETEVWRRLGDGADDAAVDDAVAELADARDAGAPLTERTLEFLAIGESFSENETNARDVRERRVRFARAHGASGPPIRRTSVTALAVIKHVADDVDATSRLVFCTEHGQVHVLSADAKEVQTTHQLPSAVAFVAVTTGSRAEGKHFIACACRDNRCYVVKDGALDDSLTIDLETPACGAVAVGGNTVVIGCVDDTAHAYALVDIDENGKAILAGQKLYTLYLPSSISAMTVLDVNRARRTERVAFSTLDGAIRVYHGAALVLALETDKLDPCVGMRFGRFGREENALVTVAANGGVATRIMPRRADLTSGDAARDGGAAAAAAVPLAVPKKTKLYVEQTAREREFGRDMHVAFQKDLCRLRLNTARARVASMRDGGGRGAPRGGVGGGQRPPGRVRARPRPQLQGGRERGERRRHAASQRIASVRHRAARRVRDGRAGAEDVRRAFAGREEDVRGWRDVRGRRRRVGRRKRGRARVRVRPSARNAGGLRGRAHARSGVSRVSPRREGRAVRRGGGAKTRARVCSYYVRT